jgi:hypothetical protein
VPGAGDPGLGPQEQAQAPFAAPDDAVGDEHRRAPVDAPPQAFPDFPGVAVGVDVDDVEMLGIEGLDGPPGDFQADRARLAGADVDRSVGGDLEVERDCVSQ